MITMPTLILFATIAVRFASVLPDLRQRQAERLLNCVKDVAHEPAGRGYVRKMQCIFGGDWGPGLVADIEHAAAGTVAVHVSNDQYSELRATLTWHVTTVAGGVPPASAGAQHLGCF